MHRLTRVLKSAESKACKTVSVANGAFNRHYSAAAAEAKEAPITLSTPAGADKSYDPKLVRIVDDISKLTLIEVSELNTLLKKTLNIPDTPMMGPMMAGFGAAAPAAPSEEESDQPVASKQSSFTLKLLKFDDSKKVALIKECKNLLEGMNLVQAKKFVESAPTVVKADLPKDEAEKLMAALQAVGATCEIV